MTARVALVNTTAAGVITCAAHMITIVPEIISPS